MRTYQPMPHQRFDQGRQVSIMIGGRGAGKTFAGMMETGRDVDYVVILPQRDMGQYIVDRFPEADRQRFFTAQDIAAGRARGMEPDLVFVDEWMMFEYQEIFMLLEALRRFERRGARIIIATSLAPIGENGPAAMALLHMIWAGAELKTGNYQNNEYLPKFAMEVLAQEYGGGIIP